MMMILEFVFTCAYRSSGWVMTRISDSDKVDGCFSSIVQKGMEWT